MCPEAKIGGLHNSVREGRTKISVLRLTGLFCLFLLIAWGLGYPTLNRYDPRDIPGLTDVSSYAAMVGGDESRPRTPSVSRSCALDCSALLPAKPGTIRHSGPGNVRTPRG